MEISIKEEPMSRIEDYSIPALIFCSKGVLKWLITRVIIQ